MEWNSKSNLWKWLREESSFVTQPWRVVSAYDRSCLRPDLVAGLTIAVVMLPQAIAYAMIAELPPQTGLFAAIVASIVGALWGSSNHLHNGPTNAISLLVLGTLLTVAEPGTPEFLMAAGYLAIMVGVLQAAMGLLRMGVLVNFVADSVIIGFTAGAGVLISFNQLRHLLRLDIASQPELVGTITQIVNHISETHLPSVALGVGTILVIVLVRKFRPTWPAALLGMVLAAGATAALELDDQGVKVLGALPRSLPPLADLPVLSTDLLRQLSAGALAVAAIGLVEAISVARSIAAKSGQRLDSNQEFVGMGLANIFSGLLSGYSVGGSFTRSGVNFNSGGKTAMASVFSGLWVLLAMLALAPLAVYLPRASLVGVLLVTAYGMVDQREIKRILRTSFGDTSIMVATMLATMLLQLEFAVLAGMLVSFARYLIKTSTPGVYSVVPDENFRRFVKARGSTVCPQLGAIEIEGSLYFGAVNHVEEAIRANQEAHPAQHFLLLRLHMVDHCDVSGIHMLESVIRRYRRRGGDVYLDGIRPGVMHMVGLYGLDRMIGTDNMLTSGNTIGFLFHKVLHPGICIYQCKERVFAECQALPKDNDATLPQQVSEIPDRKILELTPTEVRFLIADAESSVTVVDVGEASEYRNWHIHGARSLPLRDLAKKGPDLDRDTTVIFISRIGRRGKLATHMLMDQGHPRVYNMQGGMLAWEAVGFPIDVE